MQITHHATRNTQHAEGGTAPPMSTYIWEGPHVRLRGVEPGDGAAHFAWNQDSTMSRALDHVWFPQSRAGTDRWAGETATRAPNGDAYQFEIETLAGEWV